jgi:hypothetical protein
MSSNGERQLWWLVLFSMVFAFQSVYADVVTDWNVMAMEASAQTSSPVQSRALAITHAAVFDAVNAIGANIRRMSLKSRRPLAPHRRLPLRLRPMPC